MGDLTALTRLDLTGNRLAALPESLGNLTALTRLAVTDNQLTALPESLGNLTGLTRLDLAGNRLTVLPAWLGRPSAGGPPPNSPLQAWLDDTPTTLNNGADLDTLLDRVRSGGVSLSTEDDERRLFVELAGDASALVWEDEEDIMISWGPVPPDAPAGQTAADAEYAYSDPWFTESGDEPPLALTAAQARQAAHEFLRTGRRPTCVQWVDKP
ncbi:Imm1 family immunity protein [Micromonospora tarensis]|uniref:Leucine rich repeat-containing protein n=1 Tax=Micromonospora tarensis TaxID=2806100 RepID=A0ABS1YM69_9ACTN|nr:Imm1 family immunity protein [Micromonospora tarensis]MBM0278412.1 hypothetical protein [Micromonospora tarensis]